MTRPSGTVTFLFTDVEGSTRRWESDAEAISGFLVRHEASLRTAAARRGGYVFAKMGDGYAVAFARASDALAAALEVQVALVADGSDGAPISVRMGLHTGEAVERDGDYFGPVVNRAARIMAAGHGGQVLLSAVTARLAPDVCTVDLGEHRLRDLPDPERIHQLTAPGLRASFPPLRTGHETPHNLPVSLTSFIGRDDELNQLVAVASSERLVTLTGTGGAGKTRLAIEAARMLLPTFADGAWLAQLVTLRDPALLGPAVANAMGHQDPLALSAGPDGVVEELAAAIGKAHALLVIDNCEHLREGCARLVAYLIGRCPNLSVLATSREPLAISGERLLQVGSLALPSGDDLLSVAGCAAVELFVERAQAASRTFSLTDSNAADVAALCRRLDGLPLALELAAARVTVLTPAQIVARLDGAFRVLGALHTPVPHHETLRAALTWSYELLSGPEQAMLRRLSVFRGGFTLAGAEKIATGLADSAVDVLAGLVDKSLVATTDIRGLRRFHLLEVVREYAHALLVEHGEVDDARRRHLDYLLELCAEANAEQRGTLPFLALGAELDNVRAAVAWGLSSGDAVAAVTLVGRYPLWQDLGLLREEVQLLSEALAAADQHEIPLTTLGDTLFEISINSALLGDRAAAQAAIERLAVAAGQHPDELALRSAWAFAAAYDAYWFDGSDLRVGHAHMSEAQRCGDTLSPGQSSAYPAANQLLVAVCYRVAPPGGIARTTADGLERAKASPGPVIGLTVRLLDACWHALAGDRSQVETCNDLLRDLMAVGSGWEANLASFVVGLVREDAGDLRGAAHAVRDYLHFFRSSGLQLFLSEGIRAAARHCAFDRPDQAVRLWAAAEQLEHTTGMRKVTALDERDEQLHASTRQKFTPREYARLAGEGRVWTLLQKIDAAELALADAADASTT